MRKIERYAIAIRKAIEAEMDISPEALLSKRNKPRYREARIVCARLLYSRRRDIEDIAAQMQRSKASIYRMLERGGELYKKERGYKILEDKIRIEAGRNEYRNG